MARIVLPKGVSNPKPIVDAVVMHAAAGSLILLGAYGMQIMSHAQINESIIAFSMFTFIFVTVVFGLALWFWVSLFNALGLFNHLKESEWVSKNGWSRSVTAIVATAAYSLYCTWGGVLLFIVAGHRAGVVT